jgi:hypothetical protein
MNQAWRNSSGPAPWGPTARIACLTASQRLISRETGMSFGRWRRQLRVVLAVKWLAGGGAERVEHR